MNTDERKGYLLGVLGVTLFSLTFPFTKMALAGGLSPAFVGLGRAVAVTLPAILLLTLFRQPFPRQRHLLPLLLVAGGAVVGFPVLLAVALRTVPSTHAAVVAGVIPLLTAVLGSWRERERQAPLFWAAAAAGTGAVLYYAWASGGGALHWADLALFGAAFSAAIGYTEGARLGREIGSWQVICWALILSAPFLIYPTFSEFRLAEAAAVPWPAWAAFGYTALVSMFLGYFIWYRGLALGGIARVSQIQMGQPFLALGFSAILLGEPLTPLSLGCALVVLACVMITRSLKPQKGLVLEEV